MMNMQSILSESKFFLSQQLEISADNIDAHADLKGMGMDSFRIIELVLFLERRTGLSFPDYEYTPANLKSIDSIITCFLKLEK